MNNSFNEKRQYSNCLKLKHKPKKGSDCSCVKCFDKKLQKEIYEWPNRCRDLKEERK